MVICGDASSIYIPDLGRFRQSGGRLRGLRLLHTHLSDDGLTQEDLTDLLFLRLDSVAVLTVGGEGRPRRMQHAHILPPNPDGETWDVSELKPWDRVEADFTAQAEALEEELARVEAGREVTGQERALLVHVGPEPKGRQESSLDELADLSGTAGLAVTGRVSQRIAKVNPKTILGKGKLAELEVEALRGGASVIIFDRELTPAQLRNLADVTERKVLDRSQLILDIFAQHATTKAGKLQVELAQLQYTLPRLVGQNKAFSRLAGGIGGRGPGETKLEIDRRRVRDRITRVRKDLKELRKRRGLRRQRRAKSGVPVVALVGYTNAGKSTLLNTLTSSEVLAEDKLFATLDPTTRRIRFPREREVILTDTVGFIRELPKELREAFLATLEELEEADLLVHVADASHPELEERVEAVENILADMDLATVPRVLALNKWDLLGDEDKALVKNALGWGIPIFAKRRDTLEELVEEILFRLEEPPPDEMTVIS
ncbi:GTPase HflX [Desulfohalovibrio reitneri]|uniref:GTPase HflX n=1 Tax=Desulfohalovibrio reitneri TaxID=1307759 RepID=UPI000A58E980|nr:GTPase HflX [Desulfohalovibrio reitneri]